MLVPLLLFSCSSTEKVGKTEAEVLYKEALEFVKKERYILAIEKINAIKSQYPYSFYATHAELLQADILFLQENFIESAAAYILFKDFHPKHEKLAYVVWRTAESYFNQMPSTFDRDLSPGHEALRYYREVIEKFPQSEYVEEAKGKTKAIERMLLEKDLYIADFYFRTKVFDSARFRYLDIIDRKENPEATELSMLRVVESSYHLAEFSDCERYASLYLEQVPEIHRSKIETLKNKCTKMNSKVK